MPRYVVKPRWPLLNPDLTSGFGWMVALLLVALLNAGLARCAQGAGLPRLEDRTVSWYAAPGNAPWLERVTAMCRDNPGLLHKDPDCINASAARLLVAEREALRGMRNRAVPTSPAYWRGRPMERAQQVRSCELTEGRVHEWMRRVCAAAKAA